MQAREDLGISMDSVKLCSACRTLTDLADTACPKCGRGDFAPRPDHFVRQAQLGAGTAWGCVLIMGGVGCAILLAGVPAGLSFPCFGFVPCGLVGAIVFMTVRQISQAMANVGQEQTRLDEAVRAYRASRGR